MKSKMFSLGNLLIQFAWALDWSWYFITKENDLMYQYFNVGRLKREGYPSIFRFVFGPLSISVAYDND